jgi:hypothetical protein
MKPWSRYIVAGVLLAFAWRGSVLDIQWPPKPFTEPVAPQPDPAILKWAEGLGPIVSKMTPADRQYLANLYDAMAFVLLRDGKRDEPIITTTDWFVRFHTGTLRLAIDRENVGKYQGLGEAIDQVFVNAVGADQRALDEAGRVKLVAACGVLSWVFSIHHG